ncbi:MAG: hypothetical protein KatS3mg101_0418 [Patescibacteria group bacterium]|nr:MAG: hypothetical protein KatS3mg101_0418 [Patescibacteria group bacterium]
MQFKTHSKKPLSPSGVTLLEVVLVSAVLLILLGVVYSLVSPSASKAKARDNKRLSDISNLDRAINEYRIDRQSYPGSQNVLYTSITTPAGSPNVYSPTSGWIPADLSDYLPKYPTDPINDLTYYYEYIQNGSGYEISARMEYLTEEPQNDGGNDPLKYELGTNLLLISP